MADHFFGVNIPGGTRAIGNVSTGTSTTSEEVELRVLDGVTGNNKVQVLLALEAIKAKILTGNAPA